MHTTAHHRFTGKADGGRPRDHALLLAHDGGPLDPDRAVDDPDLGEREASEPGRRSRPLRGSAAQHLASSDHVESLHMKCMHMECLHME